MTLRELIDRHRVVIAAGSGGVGKTTVAASVALWGALGGRRTVVITIDPARRLADSLGLEILGAGERAITLDGLAATGGSPRGSLVALMLDQKGAWDALVERHAPAEARPRILANPFYQHLSQSFAGSHEYMAIEQLCVLVESGRYDLIVVDTPPTRHALDFLEAPRRIGDFLDRKIIRWFLRPYFSAGWSALRAMNRTAGFLLRRLEQATGVSALAEISDFFSSMSELFENFQSRVDRAHEVLRGKETAFVLVSGPEEQVLGDAEYLSTKMAELHMPLKGVVLNRVHREFRPRGGRGLGGDVLGPEDAEQVAQVVARAMGGSGRDARELAENFLDYQALARGESLRIEQFRVGLPRGVPVVQVPNFARDIHDLATLAAMHPYLFGSGRAAA
jgi:anion-transporting  ArsA/GET3 family ATPase